jgi:hypothetical protein
MRLDYLACAFTTFVTPSSPGCSRPGEPDHVVESITGHLSRRMLEHYSHNRLKAKKAALDRLNESTKGTSIKSAK